MSSRPTIKEVSKIAGVSFKTVSRVLNNEKHVSEATRRRVEEAVAALNFRPSHAARTLAGRKSFQVALLYDNPSPYYIYHVQIGATQRCTELGYRLLQQPCDIQSPDLVDSVTALIDEAHLDGLIISPPVSDVTPLLDELDRRGVAYVRIAPGLRRGAGLHASMDDIAAGRELTEHLIGLGHRAIAFIQGPASHISSSDRLAGYRAALEAHGIGFQADLVVQGDYSFGSGRAAARTLLARAHRPTAIFAGNDDMAAGALAVAHELGIAVPGELSIAGFDDSDLASAVWPPLTTIRQPVRELAYAAADLMLNTEVDERQVTLGHALVVRSSTGPAPAGR
ncbi:LacI family DNA-binding transcriptional regulator [Sphingomonas canadensis]|uniref:LacI family DNA-binding transcriptional regulator n=1 Tax=Sphingomonas canadensis TaxID=1219257 RepID=A0ABW3H5W8_9SPHN|nr:LacI family DNA-binding transcriptional regulator [Sphingomonas canadensis]MCW3836247.1 LacI family DNA-binding transcriptional regulator [Sphingomonas canadensis]